MVKECLEEKGPQRGNFGRFLKIYGNETKWLTGYKINFSKIQIESNSNFRFFANLDRISIIFRVIFLMKLYFTKLF